MVCLHHVRRCWAQLILSRRLFITRAGNDVDADAVFLLAQFGNGIPCYRVSAAGSGRALCN